MCLDVFRLCLITADAFRLRFSRDVCTLVYITRALFVRLSPSPFLKGLLAFLLVSRTGSCTYRCVRYQASSLQISVSTKSSISRLRIFVKIIVASLGQTRRFFLARCLRVHGRPCFVFCRALFVRLLLAGKRFLLNSACFGSRRKRSPTTRTLAKRTLSRPR